MNGPIGPHQTTDWTLVVEVQLVDGGDGAGVDPRPIYELHACQKNKLPVSIFIPPSLFLTERLRGVISRSTNGPKCDSIP